MHADMISLLGNDQLNTSAMDRMVREGWFMPVPKEIPEALKRQLQNLEGFEFNMGLDGAQLMGGASTIGEIMGVGVQAIGPARCRSIGSSRGPG